MQGEDRPEAGEDLLGAGLSVEKASRRKMPRVRGEQWPDWRVEVTSRTVMGFPGPNTPSYTRHRSGETPLQLCWERTLSFLSFSNGARRGGQDPKSVMEVRGPLESCGAREEIPECSCEFGMRRFPVGGDSEVM